MMDKLYQYVSTKENVGIDLDPPSPNSFCILS